MPRRPCLGGLAFFCFAALLTASMAAADPSRIEVVRPAEPDAIMSEAITRLSAELRSAASAGGDDIQTAITASPQSRRPMSTGRFAIIPPSDSTLSSSVTGEKTPGNAMLARIAPPEMMTEFFGIYSLSGTATTWMASFMVSAFTSAFHSQRAGFASILIFLVIGFLGMLFVREERASAA